MVKRVLHFWRNYPLLAIPLLTLVLLGIWLVFGRISLYTSPYKRLYSTMFYFWGDATVLQDFEAEYPGLYRIDVYFGKLDGAEGEIIFHLKDSCDASVDLETLVVQSSDVIGDEFHPFIFSPLDDSTGRRFCLILENLSLTKQNQLGVYVSNFDVYSKGAAKYERSPMPEEHHEISSTPTFSPTHFIWLPIVAKYEAPPQESDIGFQLYYNGPALDTMKALLTRMSAHKPYFFGVVWFYIFLFAVYLMNLILFWLSALDTKSGR